MSASEKLGALDGAEAPWEPLSIAGGAYGSFYYYIRSGDATIASVILSREDASLIATLRNALPQIVAVVEAAERLPDMIQQIAGRAEKDRLDAALTALDEALS